MGQYGRPNVALAGLLVRICGASHGPFASAELLVKPVTLCKI